MRRISVRAATLSAALLCTVLTALTVSASAVAAPGWTAPRAFPFATNTHLNPASVAYRSGGSATIAWVQLVSVTPLKSVLHVGTIAPGGKYHEQLTIRSTASRIPASLELAVAPDGAAVIGWLAVTGTPGISPLEEFASYRAAGSARWQAPKLIGVDASVNSAFPPSVVAVIAPNGTAAVGSDHIDPSIPNPYGDRIDVVTHRASGSWQGPTQVSPTATNSEGLALGFDRSGDLTAAFTTELSNGNFTLGVAQRPASSGVWGAAQDPTGGDITSNVGTPTLGVAPDGSAVIAFQYSHTHALTNAITRSRETGAWSMPSDVTPLAVQSHPLAVAMSSNDRAYILYALQAGDSADDCVGAVRAPAGGHFTAADCVSALNFSGDSGGIAFLGDNAYFAWSGEPESGSDSVPEASRWLNASNAPDTYTDLTTGKPHIGFDALIPDGDGGIAAFWQRSTGSAQDVSAYDAHGPNLVSRRIPKTAVANKTVTLSAHFADLWSGVKQPIHWSFGHGSTATGTTVKHKFAKQGKYHVTVTAKDRLGNQTTIRYTIRVKATPKHKRSNKHKHRG